MLVLQSWVLILLLLLLLLLSRFSHVQLCATPETAAHQAPLSLGFSRQEYWSGLPFPSADHSSYSSFKFIYCATDVLVIIFQITICKEKEMTSKMQT